MDKKSLRSFYKKIRSEITDRVSKENQAAERILGLDIIKNADYVLNYCQVGSELSTTLITEKLLETGIHVAFPKCRDNGIMTFHTVNSLNELNIGKFGIPEPEGVSVQPDFTHKTVCIVPGLAFTENGERLGYGGGFYDRFLSANSQIFSVALTFEQLIASELPVMSHDVRVNAIITEKRMVLCSAE